MSNAAESTWEPRLEQVREAWLGIAVKAVAQGAFPYALRKVAPYQWLELQSALPSLGLTSSVLEISQASQGRRSSIEVDTPIPGQPFDYDILISKPEDLDSFQSAWNEGDRERIGDLLGYPPFDPSELPGL